MRYNHRNKENVKNRTDNLKTFSLYHVVTERPMYIGQKIIFDECHHNGVFNRVQCVQNFRNKKISDSYNDLEQMISNNLDHWCMIADREIALEKVRKEKFSDYPSRLSCLYVSKDIEEAKKWAKYFIEVGRDVYSIVKIKVEGNIFTGDAWNCWTKELTQAEHLKNAEKYWNNEDNICGKKRILETIVDGEIEVVEILEKFKL